MMKLVLAGDPAANAFENGSTGASSEQGEDLARIGDMAKEFGVTLRDVKQIIDLYDPKGSNAKQLKVVLDKSEKQMGRLIKQRQALDEAVEDLARVIDTARNTLANRQPVAANG